MAKYVINVDWFELMYSGAVADITHGYKMYLSEDTQLTFWKETYSTRHFRQVHKIFVNNKEWATMCSLPPIGSVIPQNHFTLQLHNSRLYEVGWLDLVKEFIYKFQCQYEGTVRLDIALDGSGFFAPVYKTVSQTMVCVSRADRDVKYNPDMTLKQFKLGNHGSDRCLQIYNKTSEIKVSNKHYIKQCWSNAGLDQSKDVERLELSLRNQFVKLTPQYDWKRLDDFEFLASMLRTGLHKYWQFRPNKKVANVSRLPKYDYIDWDCIGGQLLPRLSATMPTEVHSLKRAAKIDYFIYLQTREKFRAQLCIEKLKSINCMEWFMEREFKWKQEFERKMGKNKNGEVYFKYLSDFKEYKPNEQLVYSIVEYV